MASEADIEGREILVNEKYREAGSLGNKEITTCDVQNTSGEIVGTVRYSDVTSIKAPFRHSFHLLQLDANGKSLIDERGDF